VVAVDWVFWVSEAYKKSYRYRFFIVFFAGPERWTAIRHCQSVFPIVEFIETLFFTKTQEAVGDAKNAWEAT
jgi:hypothetical protein